MVLLDSVFTLFCSQMTAMTPGMTPTPCQSFINATSNQTQVTDTMNKIQTYFETETYKRVSKNTIYEVAGIVYIFNSVSTKTVMATIPVKPFELNVDLSSNVTNFGVKFKIDF